MHKGIGQFHKKVSLKNKGSTAELTQFGICLPSSEESQHDHSWARTVTALHMDMFSCTAHVCEC